MSDQATSFVGSIPENYDRGLGPIFFADFADEMARRVAALAPRHVLEICAGTGIVTRRLRDLLPPQTHLTASDLNPPMLEIARAKFRPEEQIEWQTADAMALPFPDASCDMLVCQFGVMFFPDKAKSYREAYRVLMHGGHYLFSVWDAHRYNPAPRLTHELLCDLFPNDPPRFYEIPFAYHAIDPIKEAVSEAGFTDFRVAVRHIEKTVADPAAFTSGLIYGNPAIDQIRGRGGDPVQVIDALTQALRREFGPEPYRIPLQVIMFEATRP